MTAEYWIEQLKLQAHPEGGYYREIMRSAELINYTPYGKSQVLKRNLFTSIYYLLQDGQVSNFHRICSDEIWTFHAGNSIQIHVIDEYGKHRVLNLGLDVQNHAFPQQIVPAFSWFGAHISGNSGYSLVSCLVVPGFDFADFELANRKKLLLQYPEHKKIIRKLTLD